MNDVAELITDKTPIDNLSCTNYISTSNMLRGFRGIKQIDKLPEKGNATIFKRDDTLFSNIRVYFQKVWLADFGGGSSTDVLVFRAKKDKIHPLYLNSLIANSNFTKYAVSVSNGAKMPRADKQALLEYPIHLPPIEIQIKEIGIIKSINDEISNRSQSDIKLQKYTASLFKSWFIDFDPVKAKAVGGTSFNMDEQTTAIFPDSFEDSSLKQIPKGWKLISLLDLGEFINGCASQKYPPINFEDRLPVVKIREMANGITENSDFASKKTPIKYHLFDGDIVFSWAATLIVKHWHGPNSILNQHIFKVVTSYYPEWFTFLLLRACISDFKNMARDGATMMGHVTRQELKEYTTCVPPIELLNHTERLISPLYQSMKNNQRIINLLHETRNALLPQLLSGELNIEGLED